MRIFILYWEMVFGVFLLCVLFFLIKELIMFLWRNR